MTRYQDKERLGREIIAMRVAKELPDGAYVNLGIGIPTLVSSFVPEGNVVFYHSESGILNCGPLADEGEEDIDLINAGGQFLKPVPGAALAPDRTTGPSRPPSTRWHAGPDAIQWIFAWPPWPATSRGWPLS